MSIDAVTPAVVTSLVAAVATIKGISFGVITDKSTWVIDFDDAATDSQKVAAQAVIDGYVLT